MQGGGYHPGEIAIQLAQGRVVRSIHQALMEDQVATDVLFQVSMKMFAAMGQRLAQSLQVFIGTPQRCQANRFGLKDMSGFPRLLQVTARQRLDGLQRIDCCAQIATIALTNLDQAAERQHSHGFTHRVAADAQLASQFRLGR
ncbi:hypothetical protein D3C77_647170 [compost metagenome]